MEENSNTKVGKKYEDILITARELFWKYGFKRVSIEEICKKTGVSKMTFYRFFPNKTELAKTVLDEVIEEGLVKFRELMVDEIPPEEKIRSIVTMKMEGTNNISREFLADFYANPELGLKSYLEEKTNIAWAEVLQHFKAAQKQGWLRNDFKPEFLLFISQRMRELVFDEKLNSMYQNPQELIMELTNFMIYGIASHK